MFDFLNSKKEGPADVKEIRQELLEFVKEQLRGVESGEGSGLHSIQLYMDPKPEERHLYEAAVYLDNKQKLKDEINKIADDYAIDLPAQWELDLYFEDGVPAKCIKSEMMPVGLYLSTKKSTLSTKKTSAIVRVLRGQAEAESYTIHAGKEKVCIGRDSKAQTPEGFMRMNTIAFPSTIPDESNRFISRQHAHIEWNAQEGQFYLFADEGGIPPRNKVKVLTSGGEQLRLQTTQIGHKLDDGDQIVLGESALLEFHYLNETT
ncbi:MAG: FHA domain-containing protein [Sphingobacteriales bacterium]|nr:MAG: FHA domain-containing protein [Sphingobacteriales bacterium]